MVSIGSFPFSSLFPFLFIITTSQAHEHGNTDATTRLSALSGPSGQSLSRQEHDMITESKLVRRRTLAAERSENLPLSPPWDGNAFPTMAEAQAAAPVIRDGTTLLEGIRQSSLAPGRYDPPQSTFQPPPPGPNASPPQLKRYTLSDIASPSPPGPTRSGTPSRYSPASGSRAPSPGRKLRKTHEQNSSRSRLNLDEMGPVPSLPTGSDPPADDRPAVPNPTKHPTTFAEMGFQSAKPDPKDCIIM